MIHQTFVPLTKIARPDGISRSTSPELAAMAASVLSLGGLLRPLLLVRQGFSYQLLPGEEERYWAAALAAEMGAPDRGQLINAIVLGEAALEAAKSQIEADHREPENPGNHSLAMLALANRLAKIERQL